MSLKGNLENFALPDLLQILSAGGKTGTLTIGCREATGLVIFRAGKIVYARSSSLQRTLGSLLVLKGLVSERRLAVALECQSRSPGTRLGEVLVGMGSVSQEVLDELIREQIGNVLAELIGWPAGSFRFDRVELADPAAKVRLSDYELSRGIGAGRALLGIHARREELEEEKRGQEADGPAAALESERLTSLKSLMAEVRSPEFTGEIAQRILDCGRYVAERGVLFVSGRHDLGVIGHYGIEHPEGDTERRLREISVPPDEPSILRSVAETKTSFEGPLDDGPWNRYLLARLGGVAAAKSVVSPLVVGDRAVLIFYGDNPSGAEPAGSLAELDLLMAQLGLAMEKQLLEQRVAQYEGLRGMHAESAEPLRQQTAA